MARRGWRQGSRSELPAPGGEECSDEAPGADATVRRGGCRPRGPAKPSRSRPLCGHGVTVNHADGSWTTYCHLAVLPRTSGWINAGAVVGQVGSSGVQLALTRMSFFVAAARKTTMSSTSITHPIGLRTAG